MDAKSLWDLVTTHYLVSSAVAVGGALTVRGIYKRLTRRTTSASEHGAKTGLSDREQEEEEESGYKPRSVAAALAATEEDKNLSEIRGVVEEMHPLGNLYSGIISDSSGSAPFAISTEDLNSYTESGLVPILLNDSMKKRVPLTMFVQGIEKPSSLYVDSIKHELNGKTIEIPAPQEEE